MIRSVSPLLPALSEYDKIGRTMENDGNSPTADLRPVVARLREIERKCASMGSRNEEFPLMEDRVAGLIARLEAGEEEGGEALDYRRIARELFPVAHLFESTGFMSVGKEIAYIERSLIELAPDFDADAAPSRQTPNRQVTLSSAAKQVVEAPKEPPPEAPEAKRVPLPVVFSLLLLVLVAAGSAAIILGLGPFTRRRPPIAAIPKPAVVEPTTPSAQPTEEPQPTPTREPALRPTAVDRGRLAEEVATARLALAKGDLETAATHLSEAGRIDRREPDLKEIAEQVVRGLVGWAYAAAHNAEWDAAGPHLERAERTAMRFGVSTAQIEEARTRIAAMERFVIIGPGDRQTVLRSVGRRVEVALLEGGTRNGRIEGIEGGDLVLNMDNQVGGGSVLFTEEIPLSDIRSLKIFED